MIQLRVEPLPDTNEYMLCESIIIEGVEISKGFIWNGASIPRILWPVIGSPFAPKFMAPSMTHDKIYGQGDKSGFTRKQADQLFRKLLIANGVDEDIANAMYDGVKRFGRGHWNKEDLNG